MPQDQDFGLQPSTRLEAVAQHTDEEEADCDHQPQSCSDSLAAVTPADGVFGSDRGTRRWCRSNKSHTLPANAFGIDALNTKNASGFSGAGHRCTTPSAGRPDNGCAESQ
jgi:hypothetical protein